MKKTLFLIILLILLSIVLINKDYLYEKYKELDTKINISKLQLPNKNIYYRDYDFSFVQNTDDFVPSKKQDLLNIIYTSINSGENNIIFYCPTEYKECLNDIDEIASNQELLSNINNYVHPYNSFRNIETKYDNFNKVEISLIKNYSEEQIIELNNKVDNLYEDLYNPNKSKRDNIKIFHDYIIDHTKYDENRSKNGKTLYYSDIAYGSLIEGHALCGGYSDAMQLFLEKMGIKSYRVSSDKHIWNAVYLDNTWYHLDLTWDDPITNTNSDYLSHDYFLISTKQLSELNTEQHNFNKNIFSELK